MPAEQQQSTSQSPDLDWSQVRETVFMLNLAAAQVIYSLRDGDKSVDVLTDSFTSMADNIQSVEAAVKSIEEQHKQEASEHPQLLAHCKDIEAKMSQAIIAFQFYDKLVQRLDHVVSCITQLGDLVGDASRLYSPYEWKNLQNTIRARYTMEQEKQLFDSLLTGGNIGQALEKMHELSEMPVEEDDIELF